MADIIPNIALGRALPLIQNVENNSPVAAVLRLHLWVSTAVDNLVRRVASPGNVDDIEAIANVAEATNVGYANISMDDGDIVITVDNTNDRTDVILTDKVFTSVSAGDNPTDLSLSYDSDGSDTDANNPVLFWWDFSVTPNGGDITVDFPATAAIRYNQG